MIRSKRLFTFRPATLCFWRLMKTKVRCSLESTTRKKRTKGTRKKTGLRRSNQISVAWNVRLCWHPSQAPVRSTRYTVPTVLDWKKQWKRRSWQIICHDQWIARSPWGLSPVRNQWRRASDIQVTTAANVDSSPCTAYLHEILHNNRCLVILGKQYGTPSWNILPRFYFFPPTSVEARFSST